MQTRRQPSDSCVGWSGQTRIRALVMLIDLPEGATSHRQAKKSVCSKKRLMRLIKHSPLANSLPSDGAPVERSCFPAPAPFQSPPGLSHLIGHMSKTNDSFLPDARHGVQGCCLHFHCHNAPRSTRRDGLLCFSKWCIRRPTGSDREGHATVIPGRTEHLSECRGEIAVGRRWQIMITCSFITQCLLDQHDIRRMAHRDNLPC